jgi:hypothetical protein
LHLNPQLESKADPALCRALSRAEGKDVLRVLLLLAPASHDSDAEPDPKAFPSRAEYRRALIERRQAQIQAQIGPTIEALHRLGLSPKGGTLSRGVVVEGPAKTVAAALELSAVEHASLDRPVTIVAPRKS